MLHFMRRQHKRLKWVLVAVIFVLGAGMVVAYIPFGDLSSVSISGDVAKVGSESVTAAEFQTAFSNYLRNIQQQNQSLSPEIIKAFGFDRQILDYLIGQKLLIAEARRLGLDVTNEELQQNIMSNPNFMAGGSFIGLQRYEDLLVMNNTTPERFETTLRNELMGAKVQSFVTAGITVSDKEAEEEYRRRNEKAILSYFIIDPTKLESKVPASSEQDLQTYFDKNKARYNVLEKRKSRYAFVSTVKYRTELTVTDAELQQYFDERSEEYRLIEQVTAQHILFKTEGKTPEEVDTIRKKATDVLLRAKKGEDFGKLAKEFSDDASASRGGDLGTFQRGAMVPAFEQSAFTLGVGAISDLVTTEFGFHIIKVNARQDARLRTLAEVEEGVRSRLLFERAQVKSKDVAEQIAVDLVTTKDLNAVAAKHGATVKETGLLEQSAAIPELGNAMEFQTKVFALSQDQFGTAVPVKDGYAIPQVVEIAAAHPATFEEVRTKIASDLKAEKAREIATEYTNKVRQQIESGKAELAALAQSVSAEVKTSEKVTRGGSIPEFGAISERDQEIFSQPLGKASPPVTLGAKSLVFAVKSRDEIKTDEMAKALPGIREEMLPSKRARYFEAYIQEIQKKMQAEGDISVNQNLLAQLTSQMIP